MVSSDAAIGIAFGPFGALVGLIGVFISYLTLRVTTRDPANDINRPIPCQTQAEQSFVTNTRTSLHLARHIENELSLWLDTLSNKHADGVGRYLTWR